MRRRDKAVKTRRQKTLTRRAEPKAARRNSVAAGKETNVARLTRELKEAREQQTATSEVLQVISSSAGELNPVFETMLESAVRICGAKFGNLLLVEGHAFSHVANPFFTTKPAGEGTGLGLSIGHDIVVKQHGGAIEVDTQPGKFTEIRIILPRAAASLTGGRA
jgi:hypothetical protein